MRLLQGSGGAPLTAEQESGLVSIAAEHNNTEMVEHLMSRKKYQEGAYSQNGATPLMMAIQEGNADIMRALNPDKKLINLNTRDNQDRNLLHYALQSRNPIQAVQFLRTVMIEDDIVKKNLAHQDSTPEHNTPLHLLAKRNLDLQTFSQLFTDLGIDFGSMKSNKNASDETPLHVAAKKDCRAFMAALLFQDQVGSKIEDLLLAKDKDDNTPLHLATKKQRLDPSRCPLLNFVKKTRDPEKYFLIENKFGATPFSGAVAAGDTAAVEGMLKDLIPQQRRALICHKDGANRSPIHLAAEGGNVLTFNLLLANEADITVEGPDQKTALEIAIEHDQREVIESIIGSSQWEEALRQPFKSINGKLNTPLRMLIRTMPEMAEKLLDKCCKIKAKTAKDEEETLDTITRNLEASDTITMSFEFIEDTKSNKMNTNQYDQKEKRTGNTDVKQYEAFEEIDFENHPLTIMIDEERDELLQHPVCRALTLRKWSQHGKHAYYFLQAVNVVFLALFQAIIFTSENPIERKKNNTDLFRVNGTKIEEQHKSVANQISSFLMLVFVIGKAFWFRNYFLQVGVVHNHDLQNYKWKSL